MRRRLTPTLMILVCFILDTAILPVVYGGVYTVPLTAVAVLLIGMLRGRMRGLLYGTIGGLLIDITSGTLGLLMFYFMAIGYLIGLLLDSSAQNTPTARRATPRQRFLKQALWVFVLYGLGEVALLMIQYFNTATLHWMYFLNIIVRSLICTLLTLALRPLAKALLIGNNHGRVPSNNREVKSF